MSIEGRIEDKNLAHKMATLEDIDRDFKKECEGKTKEELEEVLRKIGLMTVVKSDLPPKIKTIIDSLKAIEDKKKKKSLKSLLGLR